MDSYDGACVGDDDRDGGNDINRQWYVTHYDKSFEYATTVVPYNISHYYSHFDSWSLFDSSTLGFHQCPFLFSSHIGT